MHLKRNSILTLAVAVCLLATTIANAQDSTVKKHPIRSTRLQLGAGYAGSLLLEAGVAHHVTGLFWRPFQGVIYASVEAQVGDKLLVGPKLGFWAANIAGLGGCVKFQTNGHQAGLFVRPEAGFGYGSVRIYYGHEMRITNPDFGGYNRHVLGVNWWPLIRKR
jgi:hypothetical protein